MRNRLKTPRARSDRKYPTSVKTHERPRTNRLIKTYPGSSQFGVRENQIRGDSKNTC